MATPPDMARISPFVPDMIPIVFPARANPLLNVRTSSFPLKVFQSSGESEPVVVELASLRLMDVPTA